MSVKKKEIVGFDHVAFNVKDVQSSVEWYTKNLSCEVIYQDTTWAMLKIGDVKLALTLPDQHPPHIAFRIANAANLTGSDGEVKKHRDGSSYVYASDLDGNTIEWLVYTNELE